MFEVSQSSYRTKKAIADAFQKLALQQDIGKIRIQKISEAAGVSKQTFYNHFADKQALIMWIYHSNFDGDLMEHGYKAFTVIATNIFQSEEVYYTKLMRQTDFLDWLGTDIYMSL